MKPCVLKTFITFWQKALSSKTTMEFKSNVDNEFLQKVRTFTDENNYYIGDFLDISLEKNNEKYSWFYKML